MIPDCGLSIIQDHRRNNCGDRGRLVPQLLGWWNQQCICPNFLAVVFKKQEISQQVLLLLNETQSFHINYSCMRSSLVYNLCLSWTN